MTRDIDLNQTITDMIGTPVVLAPGPEMRFAMYPQDAELLDQMKAREMQPNYERNLLRPSIPDSTLDLIDACLNASDDEKVAARKVLYRLLMQIKRHAYEAGENEWRPYADYRNMLPG